MRAERAPLLAPTRDDELGATTLTRTREMVLDDFDADVARRASTTSYFSRASARIVTACALLALVACACTARAPHSALTHSALGSSHKPKIDEGSTKNCANAAADNAAGTFQMETEECYNAASAVPGCLGSHSTCRFCQTHMSTRRNRDWPLCPAKVCDEKGVFGCHSSGKVSKRDIAWRVMREHVLAHNRMVDGVKIGKCSGTSQDRALGRFVYHDAECERQGLPGCTGVGTPCRFCNMKNAKKATKDWPVCPDVVCSNYDVKMKNCDVLKKYKVPDETPPEAWDGHSLPKELDYDAEAKDSRARTDRDDDDGDGDGDGEDYDVTEKKEKKEKTHSHHHHDDDDSEYDDDYDATEKKKHSHHDDDDDVDDDVTLKTAHHSRHHSREEDVDEEDFTSEIEERDEDEDEDETSTHHRKRHHTHSSAQDEDEDADEGHSNDDDDGKAEDIEREIQKAARSIESDRHHEKAVLSTKAAQELDSLVFSSFDEAL